jgi:3-oxoadipate enol-lactonase/4-carboxymuconolactone decarboxylase
VNRARLPLQLHGPAGGPRVVLLNPMASSSQVWQPIVQVLAETYEVVLTEYPGFGGTPAEPLGSLPEVARRVAASVRSLPPKPVHLFGYSFGAWVAQQIALQNELPVRSLTLLGSSDKIYQQGIQMIGEWLRQMEVMGLEAVLAQIGFWSFSPASFEAVPGLLRRFIRGTLATCSEPQVFRDQLALCAAYVQRPELQRIAAPTLVLRGELDIFYPRFCSEALRDIIPDSRLVEIPATAHAALLENAGQVVREFRQFVDEVENGR